MMFLNQGQASGDVLAISQPAHAWISGQLLRHWATPLDETVLFAAEQHDLAWLDWERAPGFDPVAGRPALFRDVGAAIHAPLWTLAVERAFSAWGTHVALLVSRHGSVIYTRFTDRHRLSDKDAAAAAKYLRDQATRQNRWALSLGLSPTQLEEESALIAFADTLSLALCGALSAPLEIAGQKGVYYHLQGPEHALKLTPWPFGAEALVLEAQARVIPGGRFADEGAMRAWLDQPEQQNFTLRLQPG